MNPMPMFVERFCMKLQYTINFITENFPTSTVTIISYKQRTHSVTHQLQYITVKKTLLLTIILNILYYINPVYPGFFYLEHSVARNMSKNILDWRLSKLFIHCITKKNKLKKHHIVVRLVEK